MSINITYPEFGIVFFTCLSTLCDYNIISKTEEGMK